MNRIPGRLFLQNLIGRRALIWQLVRRDFHQRYVGSAGGWLWNVIHPLVLLTAWTFVFEVCLNMSRLVTARGVVTDHYVLYLLTGYLPWFLFQETVQRSSNSIVEQSSIITKTVFPSEIIPVSVFLSTLISHLLTLAVALVVIAWRTGTFPAYVGLLPIFLICAGLLSVGLGWIAAGLQVYLRDTAQFVAVGLTLGLWVTPIWLAEEMYPESMRFLLRWNPIALLVRGYRELLLEARWPVWTDVAQLALFSAAIFIAGGLLFRQLKRGFADVL